MFWTMLCGHISENSECVEKKLVKLPSNSMKKRFPRVVDEAEEDSDTEVCGGDVACLKSEIISKRNVATMEK